MRLGDLGSFRLTMKSQDVETAAEAKKKCAQLIKQVNAQFAKSTTMRDTLDARLLDFSIQEDVVNASDGTLGGGSGTGSEMGGGDEVNP